MFEGATKFRQDISDWSVERADSDSKEYIAKVRASFREESVVGAVFASYEL